MFDNLSFKHNTDAMKFHHCGTWFPVLNQKQVEKVESDQACPKFSFRIVKAEGLLGACR